mgnify:CR=1 FL=1
MSSTFEPEYDGPIAGYVVNHLKTNYWKVERSMQREEVLQEAYIIFLYCKQRYAGTVTEPKHFMALFKTAWFRHFTDLANKDTAQRVCISEWQMRKDDDELEQLEVMGETDNAGAMLTLLRQAPREVAMVLNLFLSAPAELLDLAMTTWREAGKREAGGSRQVDTLLGLPAGTDALGATERYLSN